MKLSPGLTVALVAVALVALFLLAEWVGAAGQIRGQ